MAGTEIVNLDLVLDCVLPNWFCTMWQDCAKTSSKLLLIGGAEWNWKPPGIAITMPFMLLHNADDTIICNLNK